MTTANNKIKVEEVLLNWEKPSIYFNELKSNNKLKLYFPEVNDLIGVIQSPIHHPEGDVFNHTMMVIDEAAKVRNKATNPLGFMYSALCHDFGKVFTTTTKEDGKIISYNHERAGLKAVRKFLDRLINSKDLKNYILNMTELHMQPNALARLKSSSKATNKLFKKSICPADLILLAKADALGRTVEQDYSHNEQYLVDALNKYEELNLEK